MKSKQDPESFLPLRPACFYVLAVVAEGDKHGYGIMQDIERKTEGKVSLGPGTLYRTIKQLLEWGLLKEVSRRPTAELDDERRRYYRVTGVGRCTLAAEVERLADLVRLGRGSGLMEDTTTT